MQRIMAAWGMGAILAMPALGTTYVVNPDGTGDFPTIQAAVDAVVNGDVIELGSGVFTGAGNRDVSYHGKAITIRSQGGPEGCTIDCEGGPGSNNHRAFAFENDEGPESVLDGVTIRNGYQMYGGGVWCNGASPVIQNCVFVNNRTSSYGNGGALTSWGGPHPSVTRCWFIDNVAGYAGGAVCACESGDATMMLTECTFVRNRAVLGGGVGT
jgi:hypothetical protein